MNVMQTLSHLRADQQRVLEYQQHTHRESVASALISCDYAANTTVVTPGDVACALLAPDTEALNILDAVLARRYRVMPLSWDAARATLEVAISETDDVQRLDGLQRELGPKVRLRALAASERAILEAQLRLWGDGGHLERCVDSLLAAREQGETEQGKAAAELLEALLAHAVMLSASDIHCNPAPQRVAIRIRVDGELRPLLDLHNDWWTPLRVQIKLLAGMDIAESRRPQDGRLQRRVHGEVLFFRVASFPLLHGENLVLRVLDRRRQHRRLSQLGLPDAAQRRLGQELSRQQGLILCCGPTGSGKSSTLHALLAEHDAARLNIMTLEDPVEYAERGLCQASVSAAARIDFSSGLSALLRQDPDVLLVGEIRDATTAALVVRAALSGHQVLSTLHAGSALEALARLESLGVSRLRMADTLRLVCSQRLIRQRCKACDNTSGRVCTQCAGRGYAGRRLLMEVLVITPTIASALRDGSDADTLLALAVAEGFQTLSAQAEAAMKTNALELSALRALIETQQT